MDLQLTGKTALVTGSSAGIGEAIAKRLAKEGVKVVVHGRNRERTDGVVRAITEAGGIAKSAIGDVSTDAGATSVLEQAREAFDHIDIVVNNAGVFNGTDWESITPEAFNDIYNTNVTSVLRLVQGTVEPMKQRGWGRFVQIASVVGVSPFPNVPDYNATKAAMINLSVSLTKSLAGTGVTSNTISPGPIRTPALESFFGAFAEEQGWGSTWEEIEPKAVEHLVPNPTGRVGTPEEIADAVAFLVSPLAGYINGTNLRVDGGFVPSVN